MKNWARRVEQTRDNLRDLRAGAEAEQRGRVRDSLADASHGWTLPAVMRQYESNPKGEALFAEESAIFADHRYYPAMQSAEGSHLHAGRLLLTGGLSIFAGRKGIRSKGKLTVTFQRAVPTPAPTLEPRPVAEPSVIDKLQTLGELRDAGLIAEDEFSSKKAELLDRL